MNALILIGLCALGTNAYFIPYPAPYHHGAAFSPLSYGLNNPLTFVAQPKTASFIQPVTTPVAAPITYAAPAIYAAPVPVASPTLTKFHAQDELGQYNYGHHGGPSSHNEVRDAFGTVRGQFNYIDSDGKVQQTNYVADAGGFRVAATNLPIAPEQPESLYLNPPKPVEDTPEVAAAKADHQMAITSAKSASAPAEDTTVEGATVTARRKRSVGSVAIHAAVAPALAYGHAIAPPAVAPAVTYAANPAVTFAAAPHAIAPPAVAPGVTYAAGHAFAPHMTYAAGHAIAPHMPYAVGSHAFAPGAVTYAATGQAVPRDATLMRIENNPGHAVPRDATLMRIENNP